MLTSVVKCGEGLSLSIIIRRYRDQFDGFFHIFWFYFVSLYIRLYVLYASI